MKEFIGKEGIIKKYNEYNNSFLVEFVFSYDSWSYPAEVILPQLEKEIKGYLIENEKYLKIIAKLAGLSTRDLLEETKGGVHFTPTSHIGKIVAEYDLLDKCIPVYNKKNKLPKINGYDGVDIGECLLYGCGTLSKSWFTRTKNRHITSLTLNSDITINSEQMNEIRKYLESKK